MKRWSTAALLLAAMTARPADLRSDTWAAADAFGRPVPGAEQVGAPRSSRTVGIFYFLWMEAKSGPVLDITELLKASPAQPAYGRPGAFHWWGQPQFGYYRSDDPWVIRRHAQMLANAGVDVVVFDVTNAYTYDPTWQTLGRIYTEMRRTGMPTPQIAFFTHSRSGKTSRHLYDTLYKPGLFRELWFQWQGKPLLLAEPAELDDEMRAFFTVRESWAWTKGQKWFGDGRDKWAWIDNHPQQPGWHEAADKPEQISVCVAQHPVSNIGRSFRDGKQPPPGQFAPERGLCFQEQINRALQVAPPFVFVTGWNEWIAQRFLAEHPMKFLGNPIAKGDTYFVDAYNQEFSRDIEPMAGGHGDNYYWQFVAFVRQYKGARLPDPVQPATIRIDGQFDDWSRVQPEFLDATGDTAPRSHPAYGSNGILTNHTGRNDLKLAKVSIDRTSAYFLAQTAAPLTSSDERAWMTLYLDLDGRADTGWLGYDALVRPAVGGPGKATLFRNAGGYRWTAAGTVPCGVADRSVELSIPLSALGIAKLPAEFRFKWTDNLNEDGTATDFSLHGDAAPDDRFNYRARLIIAAP